MDDLISRQAAIDALADDLSYYGSGDERAFGMSRAIGIIEKLPLAQPQWIPVTERLPEKDGRYFVTLENGYTKILGYATTQTIRYPQGFYYISENGFAWRQTQNPVVAWMPLPEPYKGEQG